MLRISSQTGNQRRMVRTMVLSAALASIIASSTISYGISRRSGREAYGPWLPGTAPSLTAGDSSMARAKKVRTQSAPVLSPTDKKRYRYVITAQADGRWQDADGVIATLKDKVLMGHVLAQRYLSRSARPGFAELNDWLDAYADHPQSDAIYRLAVARRKPGDARIARIQQRQALIGYGDDNGLSSSSRRLSLIGKDAWNGRGGARQLWLAIDSHIDKDEFAQAETKLTSTLARDTFSSLEYDVARWHLAAHYLYSGTPAKAYGLAAASAARSGASIPGAHWIAGIAAWQLGDIAAASRHFSAMAQAETLSPWEKAAAAFWAYRADSKLGAHAKAQHHLMQAAAFPRTFYGILARKAQGSPLGLSDEELPELSRFERKHLYETLPAARRAAALAEIGEAARAEAELRALFPGAGQETRVRLLALAQALDLPAVQITMAHTLKRNGLVYDQALYPTPEWEPSTGFALDPALVFAFVRQESGFHSAAHGRDGAMGLMQLMPATARSMHKLAALPELTKGGFFEPEANLALGQSYLQHLIGMPLVQGNLIYLAAAYNAGPAKVASWHKTVSHRNDPLLFLESMPYGLTRNYVSQVLTSYWIYQEMEGRSAESAQALAHGQWPRYDADGMATVDSGAADADRT